MRAAVSRAQIYLRVQGRRGNTLSSPDVTPVSPRVTFRNTPCDNDLGVELPLQHGYDSSEAR